MDFVVERAKEKYTDRSPEEAERKRRLLLREAEAWGAFVGGTTQRQSLKFFWLEECIEGENPFIADTYKKILEAIAEPALNSANILLDTEVTAITSPEEGGDTVEVQTASGLRQSFDEVVVTLPLGCLKLRKDLFSPALPARLATAIDSIGYGCLDKVYVHFPKAFWDHSRSPMSAGLDGSVHQTSPNSRMQTAPLRHPSETAAGAANERFAGFMHWIHPTYAEQTNPARWNQQGINLATLPASCAHSSLIFYIFGDCSHHIASLVKDNPTDGGRSALTEFFKPYYTRLPGYDESDATCQPDDVLATTWAADKWAGYGSYSNFQVDLTKADQDIEVMRHGLPYRRVWFAGEHTAPFVALGTVTGAFFAGEDVAKRIAGTYSLA